LAVTMPFKLPLATEVGFDFGEHAEHIEKD
jgi:hypothetical protein